VKYIQNEGVAAQEKEDIAVTVGEEK